MKKLIGLFVLLVFAAGMSYAAETLNAQGQAVAKVIQAATLQHVDQAALDFGVIVQGTAGSVTVPAAASGTTQYSDVRHTDAPTTADHFTLSNLDTATTYSVTVPASVELAGTPSGTMSATLSHNLGTNSQVTGETSKDIYIGGTLTVAANQAVGDYSGTYNIQVTY